MDQANRRIGLLDPPLFLRKLALLIVFSLGFLPLKYWNLDQALAWYVALLLVLHIYFLGVLIWRVRWRRLAQDRRSFAVRILAVAFFVFLLAILNTGVSFWDFVLFLGISLIVHTLLLLALSLVIERGPHAHAPALAAE